MRRRVAHLFQDESTLDLVDAVPRHALLEFIGCLEFRLGLGLVSVSGLGLGLVP